MRQALTGALEVGADEGDDGDGGKDTGKAIRRAAMLRDVNPSSTLESSFESLNVKKFDIAFTVDPLFHKTSAQFDEGGARGKVALQASLQYILHLSKLPVTEET